MCVILFHMFFLGFALKEVLNVTVSMLAPDLKNVRTIKPVGCRCLLMVFLWISQHPLFSSFNVC